MAVARLECSAVLPAAIPDAISFPDAFRGSCGIRAYAWMIQMRLTVIRGAATSDHRPVRGRIRVMRILHQNRNRTFGRSRPVDDQALAVVLRARADADAFAVVFQGVSVEYKTNPLFFGNIKVLVPEEIWRRRHGKRRTGNN